MTTSPRRWMKLLLSEELPTSRETPITDRALGWLLVVAGVVGSTASFVLVLEKLNLLTDEGYEPSCNLNPILNCGSIMRTDQAEVFGFPNPVIGVALFPVVAATGAAILAGARLARWYWLALQVGATLGAVFVGWLIFQSLYRIGALCPYCMVVWAVVLPIFWYVSLRNATSGVLGVGMAKSAVSRTVATWHILGVTVIVLLVSGLITEQFWFYWSTLL